MTTRLELFHVGEVVLAGLLQELCMRQQLEVPCVLHEGCTIASVFSTAGMSDFVRFATNTPLSPFTMNGVQVLFDGAHCVDVLAYDASGCQAVAFEAKLGFDRLSCSEFTRRFLKSVTLTSHKPSRVKGSMVAILNRRRVGDGPLVALEAKLDKPCPIAAPWFLAVRRKTWQRWSAPGKARPPLATEAHVVCFDEIATGYGDAAAFDQLVHRLVGDGFFEAWQIDAG